MGLGAQNGCDSVRLAPPCRMLEMQTDTTKDTGGKWETEGQREGEREEERNCFILDSRLFESALRAPITLILGMDLNQ